MSLLLPRRRRGKPLWLAILIIIAGAILLLSWHHVLPGGSWMRNLLSDPAKREAALHLKLRAKRIELFESEARRGFHSPCVVFMGSSTIESMPVAALFPGTPSVNRGIGGESLENMAARAAAGWPGGEVPLVVIYGGSADLRSHRLPAERIEADYGLLIRRIRELAPGARILAIGTLAARTAASEDSGKLFHEWRRREAELCAREGVDRVETFRPPLIDGGGRLATGMSRDRFHLNEAGYSVLAGWLREQAAGLLN